MNFILFGIDQAKINHSEKALLVRKLTKFDINQRKSSLTYHETFSCFDISQKESSFFFHETFYSFEVNQSIRAFSKDFIHININNL